MRSIARAGVVVGLGLMVVACGGADPSGVVTPATTSSVAATSTPPPPSSATAAPSPRSGIAVDPGLLDVLPPDIDGAERRPDDATAMEIAGSAELAPSVDGLAVALYVGPGAEGAEDLAIASVARLRPAVFSEAWFRAWRDSYDEAACEPAGGRTTGSAEAELGGRAAFIGTCRNGAHTYHVHLTDPERVIAITSVGEGRYGERVVAGLEE